MKRSYVFSIYFLVLVILVVSCSKSTEPTMVQTDLTPKILNNHQPDSTVGFSYFSIDKDTFVTGSAIQSDGWDIRFRYLKDGRQAAALDLFINSGSVNSSGKTTGTLLSSTFDLVTEVPDNLLLTSDDTTAAKRIVSNDFSGPGLFIYNPSARTVTINPQKTLIIKTASGNYAKIQMLSIYKDSPTTPTMTSPIGFYSFRYVKSNTKKLQ